MEAAKLIIDRAHSDVVIDMLHELIEGCEEGWLIVRAARRAQAVSERSWKSIRLKFPAMYACLCASTGRSLAEEEAVQIIGELYAGNASERGLAIWAVGELGMTAVLDGLWASRQHHR